MKRSIVAALTLVFLLAARPARAADPVFHFVDGDGYRELLYGDTPIYRYVSKYDPADRENTFKPFHHLYGMHGEGFITKGPGGLYTHHRGMFFGFKTQYGDFWHCKDVTQQHQKYLPDREHVDAKSATCAAVVDWVDKDGKAVVRETREVTVTRPSDDQEILDWTFTLESLRGEIDLGGDPQHAGFHFRADNEVSGADQKAGKTGTATYLRQEGAKFTKNDEWLDTNWVACSFKVKDNPYVVVHMDHPDNPRPITYSTRSYGRFGSFMPMKVTEGKPLKLKYRIVLLEGKTHANPQVADIEKMYQAYVSQTKTASASE